MRDSKCLYCCTTIDNTGRCGGSPPDYCNKAHRLAHLKQKAMYGEIEPARWGVCLTCGEFIPLFSGLNNRRGVKQQKYCSIWYKPECWESARGHARKVVVDVEALPVASSEGSKRNPPEAIKKRKEYCTVPTICVNYVGKCLCNTDMFVAPWDCRQEEVVIDYSYRRTAEIKA